MVSADCQDVLGTMAMALPEGEGRSGAAAPTCPTLRDPQAWLSHAPPHEQRPGRKLIHHPPCAAHSHSNPASVHCGAPTPAAPPSPLDLAAHKKHKGDSCFHVSQRRFGPQLIHSFLPSPTWVSAPGEAHRGPQSPMNSSLVCE